LTRPVLFTLYEFLVNPTPTNTSYLSGAPAIYNLLKFHEPTYPPNVVHTLRWIYERGLKVLNKITVHRHSDAEIINTGMKEPDDWKKVCPLAKAHRNIKCLPIILGRLGLVTACLKFDTAQNIRT
jgi:hypothetical protein